MASETRGFRGSQTASPAERTQSLIVMECTVCRYLGFSYMAYPEVDALLNGGTIVRRCEQCGTKTAWRRVNHRLGVKPKTENPDSNEDAA